MRLILCRTGLASAGACSVCYFLLGALLVSSCGTTVSGGKDGTGGEHMGDGGSPGGDGDTGTGGAQNMGGGWNIGGTSDSSGGSDGTGGGPTTWCSGQAPPANVSAADYQCVDFDTGFPSDWERDDEGEHL